MNNFNLEEAIATWRKAMRQQQGLEPGFIEEIEMSLRDRIDDYVEEGKSEEEAYYLAREKSMDDPEQVADEYFIARTKWNKIPPWKKRFDFFLLLPNYLKIVARNFMRKSTYTAINVIGLIIGILAVAVVFLYLRYETSFDEFHSKSDQLYRMGQKYRSQDYSVLGFQEYWSTSGETQINQIKGLQSLPGVADATQFFIFDAEAFVRTNDKKLEIGQILSTNAPSSFFNMFDFPFVLGSAESASETYKKAVLTQSTVEKLYGEDWKNLDLLSQEIEVEDSLYQIAGIIEDIPKNSHFEFNILLHQKKIGYWGARTYLQLSEGANTADVLAHARGEVDKFNNRIAESELFKGFLLQPITSIHLESDLLYEIKPPGDKRYLYAFGIIGLIIVLITITNYTNLSIAMNAGRNREIGMRKVMGASRKSVTWQFLMEALLLALLVTPVVTLLLELILPLFNDFMGVALDNIFVTQPAYLLILLSGALFIGLLAGIYPAFYLSARDIQDLFKKDGIKTKRRGFSVRKLLITFQFMLLIGLVSVTYFINQQIEFIESKDLGYRSEGIVYVELPYEQYGKFKHTIKQSPIIKNVGTGSFLGRNPFNQTTYKLDHTDEVYDDATNIWMDYEAVKAYGLKTSVDELLENPEQAPEELFLINETAVEKLKILYNLDRDDLLGRSLIEEPEFIQEDGTVGFPRTINGFFNDINLFSLREKVEPYFLNLQQTRDSASRAIIHFEAGRVSDVMNLITNAYDELETNSPLDYQFQEDNLASLYEREQRIARLSIYLSAIAVILAIIGLIALSAFLTSLRRKEVGIRKVLGATTWQIVHLFNKEYFLLILIGLLIAGPLAYFAMDKWLATFAYAINIKPIVFVFIALITLAITILSVSWVALQSAVSNPAESLKEDQ